MSFGYSIHSSIYVQPKDVTQTQRPIIIIIVIKRYELFPVFLLPIISNKSARQIHRTVTTATHDWRPRALHNHRFDHRHYKGQISLVWYFVLNVGIFHRWLALCRCDDQTVVMQRSWTSIVSSVVRSMIWRADLFDIMVRGILGRGSYRLMTIMIMMGTFVWVTSLGCTYMLECMIPEWHYSVVSRYNNFEQYNRSSLRMAMMPQLTPFPTQPNPTSDSLPALLASSPTPSRTTSVPRAIPTEFFYFIPFLCPRSMMGSWMLDVIFMLDCIMLDNVRMSARAWGVFVCYIGHSTLVSAKVSDQIRHFRLGERRT